MLGAFPIGYTAVSEDRLELIYSIAATTTIPTVSLQINIAYDIAATTRIPTVSMTGALKEFMEITAETVPPQVSLEILSEKLYNIIASTSVPEVSMTLEWPTTWDITASTSTPKVVMTLLSEGTYNITCATRAPSVSMGMFIGAAFDIAATTNSPAVSMSFVQNLLYDIAATTTAPKVLITITTPALTPTAGNTTAWCVNLSTGAHSRYTNYPDANSTSAIPAFILSPVMSFGSDKEKYVPDLYVHCRLPDEGITLDTITDEWIERTGYTIEPNDDVRGIVRRRVKTAKGIKGTNWQVRMNNINSGDFVATELNIAGEESSRRI